jgi:hypothetical protein
MQRVLLAVRHSTFIIDLPSVDKEKDEGNLPEHKVFWNVTM